MISPLWLSAICWWLVAFFFSEILASGIAEYPQPAQELGVQVFRWAPIVPIIAGVAAAAVAVLRDRRWWLAGPIGLGAASIALLFLVIPKPA